MAVLLLYSVSICDVKSKKHHCSESDQPELSMYQKKTRCILCWRILTKHVQQDLFIARKRLIMHSRSIVYTNKDLQCLNANGMSKLYPRTNLRPNTNHAWTKQKNKFFDCVFFLLNRCLSYFFHIHTFFLYTCVV